MSPYQSYRALFDHQSTTRSISPLNGTLCCALGLCESFSGSSIARAKHPRILLLGSIAILGQHYLVWVDVSHSSTLPQKRTDVIAIHPSLYCSYVSQTQKPVSRIKLSNQCTCYCYHSSYLRCIRYSLRQVCLYRVCRFRSGIP